jgi:hypothetical protein
MLDQRRVLVVADAGWTLDREKEINQWIKIADGSDGWRQPKHEPDARREIRGLFTWLRGKFWGDPFRSTGFGEEQGKGRARGE